MSTDNKFEWTDDLVKDYVGEKMLNMIAILDKIERGGTETIPVINMEKFKQSKESALNDTVVEDTWDKETIVPLLTALVSETWGATSFGQAQDYYNSFLEKRGLMPPKPQPDNPPSTKDTKEQDKPVLFTTEDGVEILEHWGETKVWLLSTLNWIITGVGVCSNPFKGVTGKEFKYFSTKEAAEQYILENKPCLTLNECKEVMGSYKLWNPIQKLLEIARQKIIKNG